MNHKLLKIVCVLLFIAGIAGCKKQKGEPQPSPFQPLTFKFGADSTAVAIDNATMVVKNMPRSCDVTQLGASAILPSGYSISPDPSSTKDYTKGVVYTVTTNDGRKYTLQITAPLYDAVNNPYGIYIPKQLNDIRKGLNDSYVLMNDIQLPDLTAAGAANSLGISDYKDYGWFPIGVRYVDGGNVTFRGVLDGQNHVIKNLTSFYRGNNVPSGMDAGHNGRDCDGLFGCAVQATFKNIGIQLAAAGINSVAADGSGYGNIGSLIGLADSCTVTNCFVTGNGSIRGVSNVGGLIGKASNTTINKSYAALTPAAGTYAVNASGDCGGFQGWALRCSITDCYASSSILGSVSVGGLVGSVNTCTIKSSYASGNVGESPMNTSGTLVAPNSLGGLIGRIGSISPSVTIVQNCYTTAAVAGGNGSNTDFHKATSIGGLIGQTTASSGSIQISNCYAAGRISRVWTNATAPFFIGALAGNTVNNVFTSSGSCSNFWDKNTTGQTVLGGADGMLAQDNAISANGKTTAEMKTAATYSNWDFSAVWNIASGTNNGYPYLRTVAK